MSLDSKAVGQQQHPVDDGLGEVPTHLGDTGQHAAGQVVGAARRQGLDDLDHEIRRLQRARIQFLNTVFGFLVEPTWLPSRPNIGDIWRTSVKT